MGCWQVQSYTVAMDTQKNLIAQIAAELKLPAKQIGAAVSLLQDGNTIPVSYTHLTLPTIYSV